MKAQRPPVSAAVASILLSLIGCARAEPTPGASLTLAHTPSATSTLAPTSTVTPLPALTATAQAFEAVVQATDVAVQATAVAVRERMETSALCQDIPADQSQLTSPVALPAEIGEAFDGETVVFRVPAGTLVRAPVDGTIRPGAVFIGFSKPVPCWRIVRDDREVQVCFPLEGSQIVLPGYDPAVYYPEAVVHRGDAIARLDGSTVSGAPGTVRGLDTFNVVLWASTPMNPFPPYGGGDTIPIGLSGDPWYGGFPTACMDWPAEGAPQAPALPTPTTSATVEAPTIATPPAFAGVIPAPAGRIAFLATTMDGDEIIVTNLADGAIRQVPHGEWDLSVSQPFLSWHPDGQHLSFYASDVENEQRRLVLLDIETGETEIVLSLPEAGGSWAWSPDGSRLLWSTGNTLYVADARNLNPQPILEAAGLIAYATWSPDARQIALVMERQEATSFELYLISPDGSGLTRVTDFYGRDPTQGPYLQANAAWSPDGSRLGFMLLAGPRDAQRVQLCVLTVTDSEVSCLEGLPLTVAADDELAWLADSRHLLLQSGWPHEIYTLDVDNGDMVNLTRDPANDECNIGQALSLDRQFLVFTSNRDYWKTEVYILHIASGEIALRLTADFVSQRGAVWSRN